MGANKASAKLLKRLNELKSIAAGADPNFLRKSAPEISKWSVGQHYDHILKIHQTVLKAILRGLPEETKGANLLGTVLMFAGWVPRGVAEAPERLRGIDPELPDLRKSIDETLELFQEIAARPELLANRRSRLRHPRFGFLNAAQWLKFLGDHQWHHEKIVRDILKQSGQ